MPLTESVLYLKLFEHNPCKITLSVEPLKGLEDKCAAFIPGPGYSFDVIEAAEDRVKSTSELLVAGIKTLDEKGVFESSDACQSKDNEKDAAEYQRQQIENDF